MTERFVFFLLKNGLKTKEKTLPKRFWLEIYYHKRESTLFAAMINEEVNFHIMKVLNDPFPLLMMATSVDCPVASEIIVHNVIQRAALGCIPQTITYTQYAYVVVAKEETWEKIRERARRIHT